jgi:hypothetical protein
MSGFVSVGSTTQRKDIFVCRQHVANVGLTRWQHSDMLANILAVSVVLGNFVADTIFYMQAGICTSEVRSTSPTCMQESSSNKIAFQIFYFYSILLTHPV